MGCSNAVEPGFLRETIDAVGINSLENGKVSSAVIPERPAHKVLSPLRIDGAELAFYIADHFTMPSFGKVYAIPQSLGRLV